MMRLRSLVAAAATLLALPLLGAPPAVADPPLPDGSDWPWCHHQGDTDGQYCIVSGSRDGVPVNYVDTETDHDDFGVYWNGPNVSVSPYHGTYRSDGSYFQDYDVDPAAMWTVTVNTGSFEPLALLGKLKDGSYGVGGNPTTGYVVTVSLRSSPINWLNDGSCWSDGCGDDSTQATLHRSFGHAMLTRFEGWGLSPQEREHRRGLISYTNAEYDGISYDGGTNTLSVDLANPHLATDGSVATGHYTTFLPDSMLINEMGVPNPHTLTAGQVQVTRTAGTSASQAPFTLTRDSDGVWVSIPNITFSNPTYRIRPKASAPGQPRIRSVTKKGSKAEVRFRPPLADGAARITGYVARCRKGAQSWRQTRAQQSPAVVTALPRGGVTCQVRAVNKVGPGAWSKTKSSWSTAR